MFNFVGADARQSEAIPEQSDREVGGSQAEMGHGVSGVPGVRRRIHESPGARRLLIGRRLVISLDASVSAGQHRGVYRRRADREPGRSPDQVLI